VVKSELIEELSKKLPDLHKNDVELAVNCILNQMSEGLASGEHIEIRGFGSLDIRIRPPRIGRNPKTGESVNLIAKTVTHFKPGKELRDRVNAARGNCKIVD
jgi:integration host factor subunit beta